MRRSSSKKPHCAEDARQAGPQAEEAVLAIAVDAANVSRVRHVGPLHGQLSEAEHRLTVPGEATENHRSRKCASD